MRVRPRHIVAITVVASAVCSVASTASADDFAQGNTAPEVAIAPQAFIATPLIGGSDTKALAADAFDVGGADTLDRVEMCLTFNTVADCSNPDPQNAIKLTWVRSTNTFSVEPENSHVAVMPAGPNDGAHSNANLTSQTASLNFRFKFSEVSRAGEWKLRSAVARDDQGALGTQVAIGDVQMEVRHFSAITVQRDPIDFGTLGNGQSSTGIAGAALDHPAGLLITNGSSDITYRLANDFTDYGADGQPGGSGDDADYVTTNAATQSTNPDDAPAYGQVSYDCSPNPTYTGTKVRVPTAAITVGAVDVETSVTTAGTTEAGADDVGQSCQFTNGGLPVAIGTQFDSVVITGTTDGH